MTTIEQHEQDLVARLRREIGGIGVDAPAGLRVRATRRLRQRRLTKAVAAVLLVGAIGGGIATLRDGGDDEGSQIATDPGESMATTTTVEASTLAPTVTPTGPADGRHQVSAVWTGAEVVVWGGTRDNVERLVDGGRYDPVTQTWREVPPAPIPAVESDVAIAVEGGVLVCCGGREPAAALFDLATSTWRRTSVVPREVQYPQAVVMEGSVYVVGEGVLLRYDPSADTWTERAAPPEGMHRPDVTVAVARMWAWSNSVWGARNFGAEYDPHTDEWTQLPDPPEDAFPRGADIEWSGNGLMIWGAHQDTVVPGPSDLGVGALWDAVERTWWRTTTQVLPTPVGYVGNSGSQTLLAPFDPDTANPDVYVATGELATGLQREGALLLRYDTTGGTWRRLPVQLESQYGVEMVWMEAHGLGVWDAGRLLHVRPVDLRGEPMVPLDPLREEERELVSSLREFLTTGEGYERVRRSSGVLLAVGDTDVARTEAELAEPEGWAIDGVDVAGPLRALVQPTDVRIESGDEPLRCAERPAPLIHGGRRLTLTPSRIEGCGEGWFAIELYLSGDGTLAAVRLVSLG